MSENNVTKLRTKLESEESKAFRVRFKEQRNAKDLSQKAIAEELAVSIDTIRNWEQGFSMPSVDTLISICNYFGCSIDYILGKAEERTHDATIVHEITGLSEKAINQLISWKNDINKIEGSETEEFKNVIKLINSLFAYKTLQQILEYMPEVLLDHIRNYVNLMNSGKKGIIVTNGNVLPFEDISDLTLFLIDEGELFSNTSYIEINKELLKSSLIRSIENYFEDLAENIINNSSMVKKRNTET